MEAFEYNVEFLRKQSGLNYQKFCQVIGFKSKYEYKCFLNRYSWHVNVDYNDEKFRRISILFGVHMRSLFGFTEYYNNNRLIDFSQWSNAKINAFLEMSCTYRELHF